MWSIKVEPGESTGNSLSENVLLSFQLFPEAVSPLPPNYFLTIWFLSFFLFLKHGFDVNEWQEQMNAFCLYFYIYI